MARKRKVSATKTKYTKLYNKFYRDFVVNTGGEMPEAGKNFPRKVKNPTAKSVKKLQEQYREFYRDIYAQQGEVLIYTKEQYEAEFLGLKPDTFDVDIAPDISDEPLVATHFERSMLEHFYDSTTFGIVGAQDLMNGIMEEWIRISGIEDTIEALKQAQADGVEISRSDIYQMLKFGNTQPLADKIERLQDYMPDGMSRDNIEGLLGALTMELEF